MTFQHGLRRILLISGIQATVISAVLILAPTAAVRYALEQYLQQQGIKAQLDHLDVNVLTGRIHMDEAVGRKKDQTTFQIGHFSGQIDYSALLKRHLLIRQIQLEHADIDIDRSADKPPQIAGITLPARSSENKPSLDWEFGLEKLKLIQTRLHYRYHHADGHISTPPTIRIARFDLQSLATWRPEQNSHANLTLDFDDSHMELALDFMPWGEQKKLHIKTRIGRLNMALLIPFLRATPIKTIGGDFNTDQEIWLRHTPGKPLAIKVDGWTSWRRARLVDVNGMHMLSKLLFWQGQGLGRIDTDSGRRSRLDFKGRLGLADLEAQRADQFHFTQKSALWTGQARVQLHKNFKRLLMHGRLDAENTRLSSQNGMRFTSDIEQLNGDLNLALYPRETHLETRGELKTTSMLFEVLGITRFANDDLVWRGYILTRLGQEGTRIDSEGHLTGNDLDFDIPDTSHVKARHLDWQGMIRLHNAEQFSRVARGSLETRDIVLEIPGVPLKFSAERFGFHGKYAQQPKPDRPKMEFSLQGNAHSHKFDVLNTKLGGYWARLLETDAKGVAIDGLDSIKVRQFINNGAEIMTDPEASHSILEAVSLNIEDFNLKDLAHYHFHDIDLYNAIIHLRRDARRKGLGHRYIASMMSESADQTAKSDKEKTDNQTKSSSVSIDHLHLDSPALFFQDTATHPQVEIEGSELDFDLHDFDTRQPDQDSHYTLGLNIGAYGHLYSTGKIALMATKGINLDTQTWLISLGLPAFSGYLNEAMQREIGSGAADGSLRLKAKDGELDGDIDTTLTNFRLAPGDQKTTKLAFGITLDTALKLVRGQNDMMNFNTRILGDVSKPYFSINHLIREAVLAGVRNTLLSDYSPLGLILNLKNRILNLFRSVEDRPAIFETGQHYIRPADQRYLTLISQALQRHPGWKLIVDGHATPRDLVPMNLDTLPVEKKTDHLKRLARKRQYAVRYYLSARNVNPAQIIFGPLTIDSHQPSAPLSLDKNDE